VRGALGTAETYDVRFAHADSEDFGNRIGGPQPRQEVRSGDRRGKPKRAFLGPMDNAYPRFDQAARPEVDGNSVQAPRGPRPERAHRPPRDPAIAQAPRPPRDPAANNGVPSERGPQDGAPKNRRRRRRGGPRPNATSGGDAGAPASAPASSGTSE
jgi:hypothetical protein